MRFRARLLASTSHFAIAVAGFGDAYLLAARRALGR